VIGIKQQFISKTLLGCVLPYTVHPLRTSAVHFIFYWRYCSTVSHILAQFLLQPLWMMAAWVKTFFCVSVPSDVCVHHILPHINSIPVCDTWDILKQYSTVLCTSHLYCFLTCLAKYVIFSPAYAIWHATNIAWLRPVDAQVHKCTCPEKVKENTQVLETNKIKTDMD
jgi:hypothetical protein